MSSTTTKQSSSTSTSASGPVKRNAPEKIPHNPISVSRAVPIKAFHLLASPLGQTPRTKAYVSCVRVCVSIFIAQLIYAAQLVRADLQETGPLMPHHVYSAIRVLKQKKTQFPWNHHAFDML